MKAAVKATDTGRIPLSNDYVIEVEYSIPSSSDGHPTVTANADPPVVFNMTSNNT